MLVIKHWVCVWFLSPSDHNLWYTVCVYCIWEGAFWIRASAWFQKWNSKKKQTYILSHKFLARGIRLSHNSFLWLPTLKHEFPRSTWRRVLVSAMVSLMFCAITSYLRRRHLFHCLGQTVQLVRGILLDSTGLPVLQMAYLTVNDSENDNMPPNREEVLSFC